MNSTLDEAVVAAFNVLGYESTFAAVAERLQDLTTAAELYDLYPSRDALAEAWLSGRIPKAEDQTTVRSMFEKFMSGLVDALDQNRDFARAWLAAAPAGVALNLRHWKRLHDDAHDYFRTVLIALRDSIALPPPLVMADVVDEVSEALCAAAAALVAAWQADRSPAGISTRHAIESVSCLVDALLVRRDEYLHNSLLVHLHRLLALPHAQMIQPLADLLLRRPA